MVRHILAVLLVALAAACSDMDFKVNDRVVYSPRPPFSDFEIADEALRSCVEQAIEDNRITAAAQLQQLNCSDAGIERLDGLATFTGLTRLQLPGNRLRQLEELAALTTLQVLELAGNDIVDPVPLYELTALQHLDLRGNTGLQCPGPTAFATVEDVRLPGHCGQ